MDEVNDLKNQYRVLKDEVDSIQISLLKAKTPWYKNISMIVSVMALLFSFGTTYVSNKRIEAQDIQSLKSELRSMLQQLAALPSKNFELTKKYSDDPSAIAFIGGQLNQENALLAFQAADLIHKLPKDKLTAIEVYSVAVALQGAYEIQKANDLYHLSYDIAKDINTAIAAKRGIANSLFQLGQSDAGRVEFQDALNIFSKYKSNNDFFQKSTHIITLLNWASAESGAGAFDKAKAKILEAREMVESLPPSPYTDQLKGQIAQAQVQISGIKSKVSGR
jgi:tetratricopeptide (TPR) repeat protein